MISEASCQVMVHVKKKIKIKIALAKEASSKRNKLLTKRFSRRVKKKLKRVDVDYAVALLRDMNLKKR